MTSWIKQLPNQGIWLLLSCYVSGISLRALLTTLCPSTVNDRYAVAFGLLVLLFATIKAQRIPLWITIAGLSCISGFYAYSTSLVPTIKTADLSSYADNKPVIITATVIRIDPQQGRWRMDVALESINDQRNLQQISAKVRVQIGRRENEQMEQDKGGRKVLPGDRIAFRATLRTPRSYGIPGEFNYPEYLARSDIFMSAFVADEESIVRLPQHATPSLRCRIEQWRTLLGDLIASHFSPQQSAYLLSLTIGQKSRLSSEQREQLARYGISHLFSISGLHLGLVAGLIYLIINRLYRSREKLLLWVPAQIAVPLLTLPPLLAYLALSGSALPTVRAALLTFITVVALVCRRSTPALTLLAFVATIILLSDPLALFSASFQLSFAGVGALIYCLGYQKSAPIHPATKWIVTPVMATVIATIATTPIALWHFHTLAPAAILCNIIAIPLIGILTVPLALVATLLLPIMPHIAIELFNGCLLLIETTLNLSEIIAQGPLAGIFLYLSPAQHTSLILFALAVLTLIVRKIPQSLFLLSASTLVFIAPHFYPPPAPLELIPFSIGQGESLLLRLGKDKTYLIDGGGFHSQTFDVGKQLLAPALGNLGISHLNAVILSHDHPDHRKGLIHILRHFEVDYFWCSIPVEQLHWSLRQVLKEEKIPTRVFDPNWTSIPLEGEAQLDIYVPPDNTAKMNDRSLVVLAHYKNDTILLTGDLENHGVTQLLASRTLSAITALKLPHHGSRRSRPHDLIQQTQPQIAIASVGFNNAYHFPHPETMDALDKNQTTLIRTDHDGTVRLQSFGAGWHKKTLAHP